MRRYFLSLLFLLQFFHLSFSQRPFTLSEQKKLSTYLLEKHLYANCNSLLYSVEENYKLNTIQRDSFNFLHAIVFSKLALNDSAASRFANVSIASPNYYFSRCNAALKLAELNKIEGSKKILSDPTPEEALQRELKEFYFNSLFLLHNDLNTFEEQITKRNNSYDFFNIKNEELIKDEERIKKANKRSPLLAGLMSTIIPGTGKIYSGKWRQGLVSMIPLTIMGLQTYEAYRIDGIKSARFIVFGSLFSLFYVGNIYGSALSVSVRKTEIEHEVHDEVVLSMRMCLQHVFGQSY